jgi:hypothetical protein
MIAADQKCKKVWHNNHGDPRKVDCCCVSCCYRDISTATDNTNFYKPPPLQCQFAVESCVNFVPRALRLIASVVKAFFQDEDDSQWQQGQKSDTSNAAKSDEDLRAEHTKDCHARRPWLHSRTTEVARLSVLEDNFK